MWHGYLVRREWRELLKQRVLDRQRLSKIETIQRVYRGFRGRKKVRAQRLCQLVVWELQRRPRGGCFVVSRYIMFVPDAFMTKCWLESVSM